MVLAVHGLELDAGGAGLLAHDLHRGGAGGGGHALALELRQRADARVDLDRKACLLDEGRDGEGHVLLPLDAVGGGAALDVDAAVEQQRDAVLRADDAVTDVETGQAQLPLDIGQHAPADLDVEARVLAFGHLVRQRTGRLAHAHRDGAGVLDPGQGVGLHGAGGQGRDQGGDEQGCVHRCSFGPRQKRRSGGF